MIYLLKMVVFQGKLEEITYTIWVGYTVFLFTPNIPR